jgi:hypothetical protein
MEAALGNGDLREMLRADLDFHLALAEASGNPVLIEVLRRMLRPLFTFILLRMVEAHLFRFSLKWSCGVPPLASVPPLRGGDFQGIRVYRSDMLLGKARKANFRAPHRLDEPTKLSLGSVASLQSRLPFHLAVSL